MAVEGPRIFDSEPDTDTAFDIVDVLVSEILKDVPAYWFEDPEFTWLQYFNWGWSDPDGPDMDAATVCEHLDSGVGDQLFARYRAAETDETGWSRMEGRHTTVILGAMMMQVGAKISDEDLDHLRALLHEDDAEDHLTPQGRLQVLAALDNYKAGIPRDFLGPSCDNCGKTRADTTEKLRHCKRCIAGTARGPIGTITGDSPELSAPELNMLKA
ncbi:hypothetical protein OQA88_13257 [Cercophora sp. LCS_1]